jgi:hypothetical protein
VEPSVRPVCRDLEHRQRTRPVREVELPRGTHAGCARAVVREGPLPRLYSPVRPVGRGARSDAPRERRPAVRAADVAADAPSDGERERDLRLRPVRRARVDRAPRDHSAGAALGAERDERVSARVDLETDGRGVAADQRRGGRDRRIDRGRARAGPDRGSEPCCRRRNASPSARRRSGNWIGDSTGRPPGQPAKEGYREFSASSRSWRRTKRIRWATVIHARAARR